MNAILFQVRDHKLWAWGWNYKNFDLVKNIFKADEKLGYNISKIILEGPSEDLKLTQNTQPAIFNSKLFNFSEF